MKEKIDKEPDTIKIKTFCTSKDIIKWKGNPQNQRKYCMSDKRLTAKKYKQSNLKISKGIEYTFLQK